MHETDTVNEIPAEDEGVNAQPVAVPVFEKSAPSRPVIDSLKTTEISNGAIPNVVAVVDSNTVGAVVSSVTDEEVVEDVVEPGQDTDPVATLTADLQRLQAEYANYRKRVERDRAVAHESAIGAVLTELLALLDDVDRAEQHGELTGGFKAVADQLNSITSRIGLEKYGTEGEAFDPQIHEALMHEESADVEVPTASKILQSGYKYKERILRPARVSVTDPAGA